MQWLEVKENNSREDWYQVPVIGFCITKSENRFTRRGPDESLID